MIVTAGDRGTGTLHVGSPAVRAGITVFPVFAGHAVGEPDYAVGAALSVGEHGGGGVVGEVVVAHDGPRPVLLHEGELLVGGQQDRMVTRSVLVPPGRRTPVAVRCVEQGRWARGATGTRHARDGRWAPVSVRAAGDQQQVWARVACRADAATSPTGSLAEASGAAVERARRAVADLVPTPFQTGVAVGLGDRIVLMEVFDAPASLAAVWDGLLAAVALDTPVAGGGAPSATAATPGWRARAFVRRVASVALAPVTGVPGRHEGRDGDLRVSLLDGGTRPGPVVLSAVRDPVPA